MGDGQVDADAHRLAQLLGNLVSNALAYGDAAGKITVTTSVGAGVARIAVHNTGPVIAPAVMATMFKPMVRGHADGTPSRSVGLGLFIVQAIATAHRGHIMVSSSADSGTNVLLTFPAAAQPEAS